MVATRRRVQSDKVTKGEMDRFITICITNGWTVRHNTTLRLGLDGLRGNR